MQIFPIAAILVFLMVMVGLLVFVFLLKMRSDVNLPTGDHEKPKHPKGYWISIGISLGVALGVAMQNLALGVGVGVAIGVALEQLNKDNVRELTDQEMKMQKWSIVLGVVLMLGFMGVFMVLLLTRSQ